MGTIANNSRFYDRAMQFKQCLLELVELDGFTYKYQSEYNWWLRQKTALRDGTLDSEHRQILNKLLPSWDTGLSEVLTSVRKMALIELSRSNSDTMQMMTLLGPDNAYILIRFGINSLYIACNIPANLMFLDIDYYKNLSNYLYQRSESNNTILAERIQSAIFNLACKNYSNIPKHVLAAYWFIEESGLLSSYVGYNLYLFNFMAVSSYKTHCGNTVSDKLRNIQSNKKVIDFANKYEITLIELCNSFMNKTRFMRVVETKAFKNLYNEAFSGISTHDKFKTNNVYVPHTVDKKAQSQIKKQYNPLDRFISKLFSRARGSEFGTAQSSTKRHGNMDGSDIGPMSGDEYNTGYVGAVSSGDHEEGSSFGDFMQGAMIADAMGLVDIDIDIDD